MKIYTSRATKWLLIAILTSVAIFATGIVLIVANASTIGLQIGATMFGGLMSIMFGSIFFAERSRVLIIENDKFIFPRGADINGKNVFKKTVVRKCDIFSLESKFHKGDGIISGDCFFYTLKLKNGTKITVTLYAYGKEAEKEILEMIQNSIR